MHALVLLIVWLSWQQPDQPHRPADSSIQRDNGAANDRNRPQPTPRGVQQVQLFQSGSSADKNYGNDKNKTVDFINSGSTVVIAIFTILTFFVYREMLRSSKIAERAWVVSDIASSIPEDAKDSPNGFQIIYLLGNKGRTPAWITAIGSRGRLTTAVKKLPPEPDYDWAGPFPPEGTVQPPNASIERGTKLSQADLNYVEIGVSTLYIYGIVKYRDIFGDEHETRYCYVFKPGPTADNPAPRGFYIDGPEGYNAAT
ncbi:MAG: hypothetical protein WBW31_06080 [Candidatus Sulfotelmatobacter sp.]